MKDPGFICCDNLAQEGPFPASKCANKGVERNPLKIARALHKISRIIITYSALVEKSHSNVS